MPFRLRDYQRDGAAFFAAEVAKGGDVKINMPTGIGRTIVLAELARRLGQPVAFMTRVPELADQMRYICGQMGVENVKCINQRADASAYCAVILSEELRDLCIDHPRVIRQG